MSKDGREDYFRVVREEYVRSDKKTKGELLDRACQVTGLNRKVTGRHLSRAPSNRLFRVKRPDKYSLETKLTVIKLWHAANDIAGERLQPFIPDLLAKLVQFGLVVSPEAHTQLLGISTATVKRIVAREQKRSTIRIGGTTKPGSLLKRQISVRYGRWEETMPGWGEIDTVAHCGESLSGSFVYSLNLVDVATSWSEQVALWDKGEKAAVIGLDALRERLPFKLKGIDSDNGSEFINYHMQRYAKKHRLTFTRSRPYRKNDNAHVEQKNWTAIRQLVGYQRYDTRVQLDLLNELYAHEWRLYVNFFQPTMRVKEVIKDQATGKKTKRYQQAQTPYQRLMAHPKITRKQKQLLQSTYDSLNPLALQAEIQRKLTMLEKTFRILNQMS